MIGEVLECLTDSALPSRLTNLGYDVREIREGERILSSGIMEKVYLWCRRNVEPLVDQRARRAAPAGDA